MPDPAKDRKAYSDVAMSNARPVILIGRGGGGTRLLSELICSLDVFMGNNLNQSLDSVEWVKDIYPLAIESITTEIESGSPRDMFWREKIRMRAAEILKLGGKTSSDLWGWKLPETTLATQQIIRCFPNAKFIHLVRDPVLSSCRRSHVTSRLGHSIGNAALPAAYKYCGFSAQAIQHDPVHMHNAASWAYQVNLAATALKMGGAAERTLLVKFEDLCESPTATVIQISEFLGIDLSDGKYAPDIDADRLKTDKIDSHAAAEVWKICGSVAKQFGYRGPNHG